MIIPFKGIANWVAEELNDPDIPDASAFGPHEGFAIQADDGEFIGGVVYSGWMPGTKMIGMTICTTSPRWATPSNIRTLLMLAFDGYGAERISAVTWRSNRKSVKMLGQLGFKLDCAIRGTDRLLYGMLRADALKWLQQDTSHAAKATYDSHRHAEAGQYLNTIMDASV